MSWVDTYKPSKPLEIVGRVQEVREVANWLSAWTSKQPVKAMLLSGPPGVGKTLVAEVVARELGFSVLYVDPTCKKGTKVLRSLVDEFTQSRSIGLFQGKPSGGKQCLLIEVDKLREHVEMVKIIQETQIPIICMCNYRDHKNLKTLVKQCREIRFAPLSAAAVVCHASKVLFREGRTPPSWLREFAACGDMRLVLTTLQFGGGGDKDNNPLLHYRTAVAKLADPTLSLDQKSNLFFTDTFLVPLSVHDAYPTAMAPDSLEAMAPDSLEAMAKAAESLSHSDVVQSFVFDPMNKETPNIWENLMPHASIESCVAPLHAIQRRPNIPYFPTWPGKNSTTTKNHGLLSALSKRLHVPPSEFILDILPGSLRERVTLPLTKPGNSGVPEVKTLLKAYKLDRDDWQHILDLSLTRTSVPAASKAALWRAPPRKRKAKAGAKAKAAPPKKAARH